MSLLSAGRRLFRTKSATALPDREAERASGVRNDADRAYRIQRINEYVAAMSDPTPDRVAELTAFLDQWIIYPASSGLIVRPGWDDEPLLTRNSYPTRAEAVAYVDGLGGTIRPGRIEIPGRA